MPVNNPAAVSGLTIAKTQVHSGSPPAAWTDLDLSSVIGARKCLVVLLIYINAANARAAVRQNGETDDYYGTDPTMGGCALVAATTLYWHFVAIVMTDSAGKIEWKTSGVGAGSTVDILAYIPEIT